MTDYGIRELAGHKFLVMDDDFVEDLWDLGYATIEVVDLIEEYEDWLSA